MKVKDLRAALEGLPDDTEVLRADNETGEYPLVRVTVGFVKHTYYTPENRWCKESWLFDTQVSSTDTDIAPYLRGRIDRIVIEPSILLE